MKQSTKLILGLAAFALLLIGAVIAYNALSGQIPEPTLPTVTGFTTEQPGWAAPDFTVTDEEGKEVRLSDMRGRPVVLNFWASWCPPCRAEMPEFDLVHGELGGEVVFMMVNLTGSNGETVASASKFVRDQGYGFPVYYDTKSLAANAYGIRSIPATFFIDGTGKVVSSHVGTLSEAALRQGIDGIR